MEEKVKLPLTVKEQLKDENDSRYIRLALMNQYQIDREFQFI